uniref:Cytochrome c oxidase subunit 5A, mitochondrial n=1 Tax=Cyprinus carpio carpio TaxID=630221 RepID=A0A8C1CPV2_CYPCA
MISAAVMRGIGTLTRTRAAFTAPLAVRCYSHAKVETDEEFDSRWVTYFSKPDLDTWELRKGILEIPRGFLPLCSLYDIQEVKLIPSCMKIKGLINEAILNVSECFRLCLDDEMRVERDTDVITDHCVC